MNVKIDGLFLAIFYKIKYFLFEPVFFLFKSN